MVATTLNFSSAIDPQNKSDRNSCGKSDLVNVQKDSYDESSVSSNNSTWITRSDKHTSTSHDAFTDCDNGVSIFKPRLQGPHTVNDVADNHVQGKA